jgi:hypothetical protein
MEISITHQEYLVTLILSICVCFLLANWYNERDIDERNEESE